MASDVSGGTPCSPSLAIATTTTSSSSSSSSTSSSLSAFAVEVVATAAAAARGDRASAGALRAALRSAGHARLCAVLRDAGRAGGRDAPALVRALLFRPSADAADAVPATDSARAADSAAFGGEICLAAGGAEVSAPAAAASSPPPASSSSSSSASFPCSGDWRLRTSVLFGTLDLLDSGRLEDRNAEEISAFLATELDGFPAWALAEATEHILRVFDRCRVPAASTSATAVVALSPVLLPKMLDLLGPAASVEVASRDGGGGGGDAGGAAERLSGAEICARAVQRFCAADADWSGVSAVPFVAALRDTAGFTAAERGAIVRRTCAHLLAIPVQDLPPLVNNLILFGAAGGRRLRQDGAVLRGLVAAVDRRAAAGDLKLHVVGTVLFHADTSFRQNHELAAECVKLLKGGGVASTFALALTLCASQAARFAEEVSSVLRTRLAEELRGGRAPPAPAAVSPTVAADVLLLLRRHQDASGQPSLARLLRDVVECSRYDWECVVRPLVRLGVLLAESAPAPAGRAGGGAAAAGAAAAVAVAAADLPAFGAWLLVRLFELHRMHRPEILELAVGKVANGDAAAQHGFGAVLRDIVWHHRHLLDQAQESMLREFVDCLSLVPAAAGETILRALAPLCAQPHFRDRLMLVLRKGMHANSVAARVVAAKGFLHLLENPFVRACADFEGLVQEILSFLRRSAGQQAAVKAELYAGIAAFVARNHPRDHPASLQLCEIIDERLRAFVSVGVPPAVRLHIAACVELAPDGRARVAEPLDLLVKCAAHLVRAVALPAAGAAAAASDAASAAGPLARTLDALLSIMTGAAAGGDFLPEDFGLDPREFRAAAADAPPLAEAFAAAADGANGGGRQRRHEYLALLCGIGQALVDHAALALAPGDRAWACCVELLQGFCIHAAELAKGRTGGGRRAAGAPHSPAVVLPGLDPDTLLVLLRHLAARPQQSPDDSVLPDVPDDVRLVVAKECLRVASGGAAAAAAAAWGAGGGGETLAPLPLHEQHPRAAGDAGGARDGAAAVSAAAAAAAPPPPPPGAAAAATPTDGSAVRPAAGGFEPVCWALSAGPLILRVFDSTRFTANADAARLGKDGRMCAGALCQGLLQCTTTVCDSRGPETVARYVAAAAAVVWPRAAAALLGRIDACIPLEAFSDAEALVRIVERLVPLDPGGGFVATVSNWAQQTVERGSLPHAPLVRAVLQLWLGLPPAGPFAAAAGTLGGGGAFHKCETLGAEVATMLGDLDGEISPEDGAAGGAGGATGARTRRTLLMLSPALAPPAVAALLDSLDRMLDEARWVLRSLSALPRGASATDAAPAAGIAADAAAPAGPEVVVGGAGSGGASGQEGVAAPEQGDAPRRVLLDATFVSLRNAVDVLSDVTRTRVSDTVAAGQLPRTLLRLYKVLSFALKCCADWSLRAPATLELLADACGAFLKPRVETFLLKYAQESELDGKRLEAQSRIHSNLLREMEQFEVLLIAYSRKTRMELMRHFRRTTVRDFRLGSARQAARRHRHDDQDQEEEQGSHAQEVRRHARKRRRQDAAESSSASASAVAVVKSEPEPENAF